jgi:hypothetical protein
MKDSEKKEKQKKKIIAIIILMIVLAGLVLFLVLYQGPGTADPASAPTATQNVLNDNREGIDGTYDSMTREEILADLQKRQQVVTDQVSSNVTFASGKVGTTGEWVLQNPKSNSVIQQAEIYYGDDNVLIAQTVPVKPGQYINAVELLEDMKSGEYEALVYINYYNISDKTFAGKAGYKVHLTVG